MGLEAGEERRGSWPLSLANGGGRLGAGKNGGPADVKKKTEDTGQSWRPGGSWDQLVPGARGGGDRGFDWEPPDLAVAVRGRGRGIVGGKGRGARDGWQRISRGCHLVFPLV